VFRFGYFLGVFIASIFWAAGEVTFAAAPETPASNKRTSEVADKLMSLEDCTFLAQIYHPKDGKTSQLGFCFYSKTVTQGIFSATSCVGALVEPDSGVRNPFYGSKGHWGMEGKCEKAKIVAKLKDPQIETTVNPITALRIKREEGMALKMLRDEFGIWEMFNELTTPIKTKE